MLEVLSTLPYPHFLAHMEPILRELTIPWQVHRSADALEPGAGHTLVAASADLAIARSLGRRVAIIEHGAGQSYGAGPSIASEHPSYAGGLGRDAELFLHPGPHPAARDRAAYPAARVEVVGCPALDGLPTKARGGDPVVAVSFHWDGRLAPEMRSGFIVYRDAVSEMAGRVKLIGHGHPRVFDRLAPWYERNGIEAVASLDEVMRRADLYVCDNSSSIFEFASTGRPVLLLNPPFYRPGAAHGLRFWDAAGVGVNCEDPSDLADAVDEALADKPPRAHAREAALDMVYAYRSGAATRAARVLEDWIIG